MPKFKIGDHIKVLPGNSFWAGSLTHDTIIGIEDDIYILKSKNDGQINKLSIEMTDKKHELDKEYIWNESLKQLLEE